jgi:thioredoxin-like negative regulator of GroEL
MKTILRLFFSGLVLTALPGLVHAEGVRWQELTVEEALTRAAEQETQVLIDVYATWCGPCQRLDAEVFPTEVAAAATSELISIRIDAEAGEGPQVLERFHVVGYPTLLLLSADGTEIDRVFGFLPAEEFASTLTGYREGRGTIDELRAQVVAAPEALEAVLELGSRAAVRGEYEEAASLLTRIITEDGDNALGLRVQAHLWLGKYMYLRGASDYDAALAQFQILFDEFPESEEAQQAQMQAVIAHVRAGNSEGAHQMVDAYLAASDADWHPYNSVAWTFFRENFELDWATEIAQRGLVIDETAASLWDTLAEVQFANGDVEGAVESINQARTHDPEEEYYQRQLERFSGALTVQ